MSCFGFARFLDNPGEVGEGGRTPWRTHAQGPSALTCGSLAPRHPPGPPPLASPEPSQTRFRPATCRRAGVCAAARRAGPAGRRPRLPTAHARQKSGRATLQNLSAPSLRAQSPVSSPRREDPRRRLSESWTAESETWRGQRGGDGLSAGPLPFCSERRAEAWSFRKLSGQEGRCSSFCPYTEVALGPPDPASRLV